MFRPSQQECILFPNSLSYKASAAFESAKLENLLVSSAATNLNGQGSTRFHCALLYFQVSTVTAGPLAQHRSEAAAADALEPAALYRSLVRGVSLGVRNDSLTLGTTSDSDPRSPGSKRAPIADTPAHHDCSPIADTQARAS